MKRSASGDRLRSTKLRSARMDSGFASNTVIDLECLAKALIDTVPQAIFAVNGQGNLLFQNATAREVLERGDGVRLKADKLTATTARDANRMATLVARCAKSEPSEKSAGGWIRIERRSTLPYALLVTPLHCPVGPADRPQAGAALILVHDFERSVNLRVDALRELFGLTPAESRLSFALLRGHSIDSAAELMNVSPNTARAQLRSIFSKLDLSRQQQLIRVLVTLTTFDPSL